MSHFIAFISLQGLAGIILIIAAFIIFTIVIFLIASSQKSEDLPIVKNKLYKKGKYYFIGLFLVLIIISFISLRWLPYRFQGETDEAVTVVGIQWDWEMAHGLSNKSAHEFSGKNQISLPVNKRITFIITSDDVIHSFCLYNNKGVLLAQAPAIPQYKNNLQYLFKKKGDYTILCLEYCGLAHPFMAGTIHVE